MLQSIPGKFSVNFSRGQALAGGMKLGRAPVDHCPNGMGPPNPTKKLAHLVDLVLIYKI